MSDTDLAIRTQDLTKLYGRTVGCENICLDVRCGQVFGFLGPNGAGKSTFIKLMVGLHAPTSGTGEILGRPLDDFRVRADIGFLPENFRYQEWLSPSELLAFHGRLLGMGTQEISESARRVLEQVGLADHAEVKLKSFSKGMQQRFGLAAALLSDPKLLFLDEPTSALDPLGRAEVRQLLLDVRDRGTTVFLNSHLLGEVEQVCDEIAVIDHGHLVASGPLHELLAGPCEAEVTLAEPLSSGAAESIAADVGGKLVEESGTLLVIGLPSDDAIPPLVERLVQHGARVKAVERRKRTLESLFFEVTEERHRG